MKEELDKLDKKYNKMEKTIKIMEKLLVILHIAMLIIESVKFFTTKNTECLTVIIWVMLSMSHFNNWVHEKKWSETKVGWRDKFIQKLFKELNEKDEEIRKLKRGEKHNG